MRWRTKRRGRRMGSRRRDNAMGRCRSGLSPRAEGFGLAAALAVQDEGPVGLWKGSRARVAVARRVSKCDERGKREEAVDGKGKGRQTHEESPFPVAAIQDFGGGRYPPAPGLTSPAVASDWTMAAGGTQKFRVSASSLSAAKAFAEPWGWTSNPPREHTRLRRGAAPES